MNNREQFYLYKRSGLLEGLSAEDRVKNLVDMLLDAILIPVPKEEILQVDQNRLTAFSIDRSEPVNFAALRCVEAEERDDGVFDVTIEEAAPDECPSLFDYIEEYMAAYGWTVNAKTEW